MADEDNANDLGDGLEGDAPAGKKSGVKGAFPQLLKMVAIGVAAVIFIVTIVVVTTAILNKGGSKQTAIPVSEEYTPKRESYDWYTSLDQIRTSTSDAVPASVTVAIALGYKKDDKMASSEITERRIEIIDFLRRFFSEQTVEDLKPQNEELLRQQIRDQINDDILSNSRIRDVRFTGKDVVQQ
ncbi:MAG: flagellar basal body-associated FliL family protein [Spirochaetales bacterium]|nr:flagellar basal body-associated FliL family protein [Spirochaetales bacterium]